MKTKCLFMLQLALLLNLARAQQPPEPQDGEPQATQASQIATLDELWQQAQALQSAGKAAEAITAGERVLTLERELYGDTHEKLAGTMEWLSQQYLAQQNLPQAETYAVELQRVQEALHGKINWQAVSARWYLDYVRKLSKVEPATLTRMLGIEAEFIRLLAEGKQAEAASELEKLIPLEEAALGSDHPFFANTFANQAECLLTAKQFAAAESAASRALSIRRKQLGDQHPDTAMAAFLLARSLIGQDRHSEAVERLILARDAMKSSGQSVNAAWMDSWRGDSLVVLKRYAEASAAYEAALAVFREQKEAEGEAQQLKTLADLDGSVDLKVERDHLWEQARQARANGTLTEAAGLGERMLAIERVWLTSDSSVITESLDWLADVYEDLEQWGEAESLRKEILHRETARLGENHWQVTDARLAVEHVRHLASLTDEQHRQLSLDEQLTSGISQKRAAGAFSDAIPDAERICKIRKNILGERHRGYASSLNNLAELYHAIGDSAKAELLCLQASEITKVVLGERHPDYATSLNNLAGLYASMGDFAKEEPLLQQVLQLETARRGETHWCVTDARLAVEHTRRLASLTAEQRGQHKLAEQLNSEVNEKRAAGAYSDAVPMAERACEIRKAILGERHPQYAASLSNLASLYESMGDFTKAESLYLQALKIQESVLGGGHPDYAISLNNLADLYRDMADYTKAEPLYIQALEIQKTALGDRHLSYAISLHNLATLYESTADFAKAESLHWQALAIQKAIRGEFHPDYATSLNNLAHLYVSMANFPKAEPLYLQALEIQKAVRGERHPDYASSLSNLAALYDSMGDFAKAELLYLQALEIKKSMLGEHHPSYAATLNNLAVMYESTGDSAKAEPLFLQASEIAKAVLGDRHPRYATSLNNLAHLYRSMGDFTKSAQLYTQAHEITGAVLGERHPDYATSLHNLATLYTSIGDFSKAELLYLQALEIRKVVLGERHLDYANTLNNLAVLYESMGEAAKAEPLQMQALDVRKSVLGERHPDYATTLHNLAVIYASTGDVTKAEPLYLQTVDIQRSVLGERHPNYARTLNNLAEMYCSVGDFGKAELRFLQALDIQKTVLGERHLDYATSLNNLAGLYRRMGDLAKAEPLHVQSLGISRDILERAALMQSERQQLAMGQMLRHQLDSYVSFTLEAAQFQASAAREVLRWKGATLVRQRAMRLAAEDPAIADRFRALQQVSRRLASLSRATPAGDLDNWKTQITDLTAEKERLEAQLSGDSSAFRSAMEEITPQQIQAAVPRDAVLIDYLQFTRSRPAAKKGQWDFTTSLLAVIVKHDAEPQLVELGAVSALSGAIDTWRETFGMSPQGQQAGLQIRRQIWEPLLLHIGDATTILVSVDGVLGRLPLGALPGKAAGTYLIEDHRLAMIPVPQLLPALVSDLGRRDLSRVLLLLGDVDYDSEPGAAEDSKPRPYRPSRNRGGRLRSGFKPLAASLGEIAAIQETFTGKFTPDEDDVAALKKGLATERRFRELAPQFYHLHIATHGFFSPATVQSALSPEAIREGAERRLAVETPAASSLSVPRITGIGASLAVVTDGAVVEQLVPDGPAARHGKLKTGDVIIGVGEGDNEIVSVAGMSLEQIVQRIRGQEGSTVRLQIKPADSDELQVYSLVRAVVPGTTAGVPATSNTALQMDPAEVHVTGYNPDLLSGLAFAGANRVPADDADDGILTAQEIAFLPLGGVETVVLSACETGLGSTAGGEGLIGLQRAFQISGARTTVASFWKVDDLVTRLLMERFYANLWEKDMPRLDALREAQLYVLNNNLEAIRGASLDPDEQSRTRVSPLYWAAFTLSGDWR